MYLLNKITVIHCLVHLLCVETVLSLVGRPFYGSQDQTDPFYDQRFNPFVESNAYGGANAFLNGGDRFLSGFLLAVIITLLFGSFEMMNSTLPVTTTSALSTSPSMTSTSTSTLTLTTTTMSPVPAPV